MSYSSRKDAALKCGIQQQLTIAFCKRLGHCLQSIWNGRPLSHSPAAGPLRLCVRKPDAMKGRDWHCTFPDCAALLEAHHAGAVVFSAEILGLLVWALGAWAQDAASQPQGGPAGEVSQGPSQAELDRANLEPADWLTYNKGYLGYRYSTLAQINATERFASRAGVFVQARRAGFISKWADRLQWRVVYNLGAGHFCGRCRNM